MTEPTETVTDLGAPYRHSKPGNRPVQFTTADEVTSLGDLTGYSLEFVVVHLPTGTITVLDSAVAWDDITTGLAELQFTADAGDGAELYDRTPGEYRAQVWAGNTTNRYPGPRFAWSLLETVGDHTPTV